MNTAGNYIVQANGVALSVETFGDRADPAIALIHGAGSSLLNWEEEFCERLAAGRRFVIRYDLRGAGRSVAPDAFSLRDLVADAVGLLDHFGVERAHVLGMSLGGAVAQLLALDHPERVASLILVSTTPGGPGHPQPDLPAISPELAALFADEPPVPDWTDRAAVIEYIVALERPFAARFDEAAARDLAGRIFDRSTDLSASLTEAFEFDIGEPWRQRLGEITAPTLVIHGREDPMFPYGHARALASEIPGGELIALEETGHEYFPRATWGLVVPAILQHTAGETRRRRTAPA